MSAVNFLSPLSDYKVPILEKEKYQPLINLEFPQIYPQNPIFTLTIINNFQKDA